LFELAGTGTIFLDEISEMPVNLQAKLLRVLQERKFRKVGGTKDIPCRATVVASSNRDIGKESRAGTFRPDLYYRLAVLPIALVPLRHPERRDDIRLLAEHFIATLGDPERTTALGLSRDALELLLRHDWPGNVRELRTAIERAVLLERGPAIMPESLVLDGHMPEMAASPGAAAGDLSLETAERLFITRALQETGWQRTRAAALLGITRATLHAKLKRYKITSPDVDDDADAPAAADEQPDTRLSEASL
jgi:transcriptional regulator with PAS, ATPase and Fis domain